MKFLLDQDVYTRTAQVLISLGHDVIRAAQIGLFQAKDEDLLHTAQTQGRIFVTRDRDFGHLIFVKMLGGGVIYLRLLPSTQNVIHAELEKVLKAYPEDELMKAFVVIDPNGHRFRKTSNAIVERNVGE